MILAPRLRRAGLNVRVAADGPEALDRFETWCPLLVTLDPAVPTFAGIRLPETMAGKTADIARLVEPGRTVPGYRAT
jgi:CheY-like chemotaxis protein